ncbi:mCG142215, isoform CRA_b [Mus musculus]|nr:mCG142215, isoform CRA_b [Mus musculus]
MGTTSHNTHWLCMETLDLQSDTQFCHMDTGLVIN